MNGWLHCFDISEGYCKHIERTYKSRIPDTGYKRRKHFWFEYKDNTFGLLTLETEKIITYHFDDGEFIEKGRLEDEKISIIMQATN